jgi:hypothetical protein
LFPVLFKKIRSKHVGLDTKTICLVPGLVDKLIDKYSRLPQPEATGATSTVYARKIKQGISGKALKMVNQTLINQYRLTYWIYRE